MIKSSLFSPSGLFVFYILSFFLIALPVQAQSDGRIIVTITNGTTGEPLAGQTVFLQRHRDESEAAEVVEQALTDRSGQYVFSNLPADGAHYVVETRYIEIPYTTGHIAIEPSTAQQDIELNVYDITTEDTDLSLSALHLVIEASPTLLDVTEILVVRNSGTRSYFPPPGVDDGMVFSLPAGAFQLQPLVDGLERKEQGVVYSNPIPPGDAQIVFRYNVDRGSVDQLLSKQMDYDVGRLQVLISPSSEKVTASNLTNDGVQQIGDTSYLLLSNSVGLQQGMSASVEFSAILAWQVVLKWGILGVVVLMVIAGTIIGIRTEPEGEEEETPLRTLSRSDAEPFDAILHSIADLDDQYERGDLDEKIYRRRRKNLHMKAIRLRISEAPNE
jgi:hypothetical protein